MILGSVNQIDVAEFDPSGPLDYKVVEKVFVRTAPVLDLRVGERTITTTGEHPFFAEGSELGGSQDVGVGWAGAAVGWRMATR